MTVTNTRQLEVGLNRRQVRRSTRTARAPGAGGSVDGARAPERLVAARVPAPWPEACPRAVV